MKDPQKINLALFPPLIPTTGRISLVKLTDTSIVQKAKFAYIPIYRYNTKKRFVLYQKTAVYTK